MTFDQLMQKLAEGGPRVVSSLAQLLLEYCRANTPRVRADLANLEKAQLFAKHRRRMRRFFDELGEEVLEESDLVEIATTMRVFAEGTSEALSVRATVDALDDALGALIIGSFRNQSAQLSTLSLIPYPSIPLKVVLGVDHLSTRPETAETSIDRTSTFGLPPTDLAGVQVFMDWRLEDLLAPLRHAPGLSVGDPGTSLAEMRFERYQVEGRDVFYDVRPRDAVEHRARVMRLVEQARARRCHVLVFPELSIDDETLDAIRTHDERPLLVVAGSRHTPAQPQGPGDNVAVVFVGSEERSHIKFRPFDFVDRDANGEATRRTEHLLPRNAAFTIFMSQSWSFCVLICKDFLSPEVQRLLVSLRVRLILVPTLSMEIEDFRVGVEHVALHGQALTLIANEPSAGSFFGHPIRGNLAEKFTGETGRAVLHVIGIGGVLKRYLTNA